MTDSTTNGSIMQVSPDGISFNSLPIARSSGSSPIFAPHACIRLTTLLSLARLGMWHSLMCSHYTWSSSRPYNYTILRGLKTQDFAEPHSGGKNVTHEPLDFVRGPVCSYLACIRMQNLRVTGCCIRRKHGEACSRPGHWVKAMRLMRGNQWGFNQSNG